LEDIEPTAVAEYVVGGVVVVVVVVLVGMLVPTVP
jgi:hypothetical protein